MLKEIYSKVIKRGDTVLDIGANIGMHTIQFSRLVGKNGSVIAFEPVPETREILKSNVSRYNNVLVSRFAVADYDGSTLFVKAVHSSGTMEESGMRHREYNDVKNTNTKKIIVDVVRVDSLDTLDNISFIKMDIEGGEIEALEGARETIKKYRPYMSVEYGDKSYLGYGHNELTLWNLSKDIECTIFDIYLNKLSDVEQWMNTVNHGTWDFILVPNEKVDKFISEVVK